MATLSTVIVVGHDWAKMRLQNSVQIVKQASCHIGVWREHAILNLYFSGVHVMLLYLGLQFLLSVRRVFYNQGVFVVFRTSTKNVNSVSAVSERWLRIGYNKHVFYTPQVTIFKRLFSVTRER